MVVGFEFAAREQCRAPYAGLRAGSRDADLGRRADAGEHVLQATAARAGASSRSPADDTPPPIATTSGSNVLIALATPMPTRRPSVATHSIATASPACAAATASGPSTLPRSSRDSVPSATVGLRRRRVAREAVEHVAGGQRLERAGLREASWLAGSCSIADQACDRSRPPRRSRRGRRGLDHDAAADACADGDHHETPCVEAGRARRVPRRAPRRSRRCRRRPGRRARSLEHRAQRHVLAQRDVDGRAHATGRELDHRRDADPDRREIAAGGRADATHHLIDELLRAVVGGGRDLWLAEVLAAQRGDRHLRATDVHAHDRRRLRRLARALSLTHGPPRCRRDARARSVSGRALRPAFRPGRLRRPSRRPSCR